MKKSKINNSSSIPTAIEELKRGNMLIVLDDSKRENQGDIIFAAEHITTEKANFLMKDCRGMFCVPMTREKAVQLEISPMVPKDRNKEKLQCNFGVTVDAKKVTSFGISAEDRALTVRTMASKKARASDLVQPGHVFPLIAVDGGVLERNGHTEATIDLIKLAGLNPVGVLSEIINDDGKPSNLGELIEFGKKHNLKIITIPELIKYLKKNPFPKSVSPSVIKLSEAKLPTKHGNFTISIYHSINDGQEHTVLTMGNVGKQPVLTRIHSQCLTGDSLFSLRCDCGEQLEKSMEKIGKKGSGIIIYLNQEGRGIGLSNKIKAYTLQDKERLNTYEANISLGFPGDARTYDIAIEILKDLKVSKISLLTNNPDKLEQLHKAGITIHQRIPLEITPTLHNKSYLLTKKQKSGHHLTLV